MTVDPASTCLCCLQRPRPLHRLRLRDPWEFTQPPGTHGQWRRRFGRPARLPADERVVLVVSGKSGLSGIWVNGVRLGHDLPPGREFAFDVTPLLGPRNQVVLETLTASPVPAAPDSPSISLLGEVHLEILHGSS